MKNKIQNNLEMLLLLKESPDKDLFEVLLSETKEIENLIEEISLILLLNGPYDDCDCILEIHPGAGGTESCDWANMLYRMYTRYFDKKNYAVLSPLPAKRAEVFPLRTRLISFYTC